MAGTRSAGAQFGLYGIVESTRGTTPTSPAMATYRPKAGTMLKGAWQKSQAGALRADRMTGAPILGRHEVTGKIAYDLTYGELDAWIESLMCGTWNTNVLNPGSTRRYWSLMQKFADQAAGDEPYHVFNGMFFNGATIQLSATGEAPVSI
jgi:hypothetical protein